MKGAVSLDTNLIQKVGQIGVPVKDLSRAIGFYKDKIGLSLLFNTDSMAFFECNNMRLLLSLQKKRNMLLLVQLYISKWRILKRHTKV